MKRRKMKQLTDIQTYIFLAGGVLMVIGAGCFAFMWQQQIMCWVYLVGSLMFSTMQIMQTYDGRNKAVVRLKKIMTTADLFFIISGILMVDTAYRFLQNAFTSYVSYLELVFNKWVLLLLVAAVLELYTMHRISSELKDDEKSGE
ncbi:MAG: hypothetical protein ACI3YB_05430 [Prevotella sp.]